MPTRFPIANSDHNTVYLIPIYKTVLKSFKPKSKTVAVWLNDNVESLKGCFLCTDWTVFHCQHIDIATEAITAIYIFVLTMWSLKVKLLSI